MTKQQHCTNRYDVVNGTVTPKFHFARHIRHDTTRLVLSCRVEQSGISALSDTTKTLCQFSVCRWIL